LKTPFSTSITLVVLMTSMYGQNITNTLGSGGSFVVKDGSTTFLSLSQADGNVSVNNTLTLPVTTASTLGVIFKDGLRFVHDFQAAGTAGCNTFIGTNSGNFTMSGSGADASYNTGVGRASLAGLTAGYGNSALGYASLSQTTTGNYNSAFGYFSLIFNTTGSSNSAFGASSLDLNTTGNNNSAFGYQSLHANTTGSSNSAFGPSSLSLNTTGTGNAAFGTGSLSSTTGNYNSAFGYGAGALTTGSNNTCLGNGAQVPSDTASNQVRVGNVFVTYAGVQISWTVTSDRRWKSNIVQSNLGLNFIAKLQPVSYVRKNDEKKRIEYGFIAQEVEEVLKGSGVENAGMLTIDDAGRYELRYNDLFAPMVKAIQELKYENNSLKTELEALKRLVHTLDSKLAAQ